MSRAALTRVLRETVRRNRVRDGIVYLQVTRGAAPPRPRLSRPTARRPTVVVTAKSRRLRRRRGQGRQGRRRSITTPDIRWGRCDIKTVGLLPNVLAKQAAKEAGRLRGLVRRRRWAWSPRAPRPTPGSSTRTACCAPATPSANILRGVTRTTPDGADRRRGAASVEERPFTRRRGQGARRRPSSPPPAPSSCRSWRSTASRSATASPGPVATRLRASISSRRSATADLSRVARLRRRATAV